MAYRVNHDRPFLKALDTNRDGKVSKDEALTAVDGTVLEVGPEHEGKGKPTSWLDGKPVQGKSWADGRVQNLEVNMFNATARARGVSDTAARGVWTLAVSTRDGKVNNETPIDVGAPEARPTLPRGFDVATATLTAVELHYTSNISLSLKDSKGRALTIHLPIDGNGALPFMQAGPKAKREPVSPALARALSPVLHQAAKRGGFDTGTTQGGLRWPQSAVEGLAAPQAHEARARRFGTAIQVLNQFAELGEPGLILPK